MSRQSFAARTQKTIMHVYVDKDSGECKASKLRLHVSKTYEPRHEISSSVVCATSKASDHTAHTRSLIKAVASY